MGVGSTVQPTIPATSHLPSHPVLGCISEPYLALAGAVTVLKPSCFSREGKWLSQVMQRSKASITHRLLGDTPREKAVETGPSPVPQPRAPTGDVITRLCSAGSEN